MSSAAKMDEQPSSSTQTINQSCVSEPDQCGGTGEGDGNQSVPKDDEVIYANLKSLGRTLAKGENAETCEDENPVYMNSEDITAAFYSGLSPLEIATAQRKGLVKQDSSTDIVSSVSRQDVATKKTTADNAGNPTSNGKQTSTSDRSVENKLVEERKRRFEPTVGPTGGEQSPPGRAGSTSGTRPARPAGPTAEPPNSGGSEVSTPSLYENVAAGRKPELRPVPKPPRDPSLNQLSPDRKMSSSQLMTPTGDRTTSNTQTERSQDASTCGADEGITPTKAEFLRSISADPAGTRSKDIAAEAVNVALRRHGISSASDARLSAVASGDKILNRPPSKPPRPVSHYESLSPAPPVPEHASGTAPSPTSRQQRLPCYCGDFLKSGCQQRVCTKLHVCANWLTGHCGRLRRCRLPHSLSTVHNLGVLQACGWREDQCDELRRWLYFQARCQQLEAASLPPVCVDHARGLCQARPCDALHICPRYLQGVCTRQTETCPLGHELFSESNRQVVLRSGNQNETSKKLMKKIAIYLQ